MNALAPHWGALLALALFLIVGLAVLDDYGIEGDEYGNALRASIVWAFLGGEDTLHSPTLYFSYRLYGPSFELALLFAERALGIEGGRGVYLSQHLLVHLTFLTGGLFAYLLARRLFGVRALALFAMLLLLLHPRLYAHSFADGKDISFLVAFIVALYLAHRAFRRDSIAAFALLGVGVGIAVNLRVAGVFLLAAIPALRALDFAFASGWAKRKRALLATGAFALASLLTAYALLPYLWADPLARAVEWWTTLSDHPHKPAEVFRGSYARSSDFSEYIPVWLSITSPPFALLLGLIGGALILLRAAKAPREALRNTRLRFGLLLAGCFALPVLAVILMDGNIYHGWRHVYFLWAPFALLAVYGLRWLARRVARAGRSPSPVYGAAGLGLAAAVVSMALIHPNQQVYFNFSMDRVASEYLQTQYSMVQWGHPARQALEWIVESRASSSAPTKLYGDETIAATLSLLPERSRRKFEWGPPSLDTLAVTYGGGSRPDLVAHRVQVYGNTVMTVDRKDDLQAVYEATRTLDPILDAAFDVYRLNDGLAIVMEPCAPSFLTKTALNLRTFPVNRDDLPYWLRDKGFEPWRISLAGQGAFFDGKCVTPSPIPGYPIAGFEFDWEPELLDADAAREAMRRARQEGRLLARSAYDLYLSEGQLVYVQEQCDPLDTEHPFRVSVFPQRASDLPDEWRQRGYERFWFEFHKHGALLEEGACVALFPLPDYPIAAVRTAQYIESGDDVWSAVFSANADLYQAAYRVVEGSEPLARGAFDIHVLDGDVVYAREPCAQSDTEARFFLHVVPERASDLPEARQEAGFDNLDFRFFRNGARFDGKCAARVPLPPYPIASVRTGQYVSGVGEIWSAEFPPSPDGGRGQPRSGG